MRELVIEGQRARVTSSGANESLRATVGEREVELAPWTWADHLAALRRHLRADGGRLTLDEEGYAREVLRGAPLDDEARASLVPMALWWAAGAGRHTAPSTPDPAGWVHLSTGLRARVRAWSWRQRLAAMRDCVEADGDAHVVDPLRLIELLLATTLIELEHPDTGRVLALGSLDAAVMHELLAVLTKLSMPSPDHADEAWHHDPAIAKQVLRLCGALGWTPSQVLDASAAEIDMVRWLLEHGEARGPAPSRRRASRLHDHPDAMVLEFAEGNDP